MLSPFLFGGFARLVLADFDAEGANFAREFSVLRTDASHFCYCRLRVKLSEDCLFWFCQCAWFSLDEILLVVIMIVVVIVVF